MAPILDRPHGVALIVHGMSVRKWPPTFWHQGNLRLYGHLHRSRLALDLRDHARKGVGSNGGTPCSLVKCLPFTRSNASMHLVRARTPVPKTAWRSLPSSFSLFTPATELPARNVLEPLPPSRDGRSGHHPANGRNHRPRRTAESRGVRGCAGAARARG